MKKTARAIIIRDDELLVFYRRKTIADKVVTYYAIPGGHVEKGETCEDTVVRELKEETNLDIEIIHYLGKLIIDGVEENYYYAKIVGGELRFGGEELERNCADNYYEIRWLPLRNVDNSGIRSLEFIKKVVNYED